MFKAGAASRKKRKLLESLHQQRQPSNGAGATATATAEVPAANDHHEADGDDDDALIVAARLRQTRQKRQLLTRVQYKRGLESAALLTKMTQKDDYEIDQRGRSNDANHSNSTTANTTATTTTTTTVLEQKHALAMQEFVQQKLLSSSAPAAAQFAAPLRQRHVDDEASEYDSPHDPDMTTATAFNPSNSSSSPAAAASTSSLLLANPATTTTSGTEHHDHGLPTAALVEVILPVEQRLQTVQATMEATLTRKQHGDQRFGRHHPSAVSVQALRFRRPQEQQQRQQQQLHPERQQHAVRAVVPAPAMSLQKRDGLSPAVAASEEEAQRPGFEALRQRQQQHHHQQQSLRSSNQQKTQQQQQQHERGSRGGGQRPTSASSATDDRVYQRFMARHQLFSNNSNKRR